ncbi:NFACT family protein [Microaerobacter geothermalis]|uniref:Rqc2 family fibronectin-binding protein n=1 Tax=Microaerobacter geothermalis TaxID=674972 RepID=UPI001F2B394F|nr:NFACT RNA binding domain-containing protein [Microaerobacter geothermalis]MCF6094875.1 NFACT family protein [Microaerobacter geothermalis]
MSFDGFVIHAIANELKSNCLQGKISKIYQPEEEDLVFHIRAKGKNLKILLSANPAFPRVYLTDREFQNPAEPPMFCMLLRKHLEGGIIEEIEQVNLERIIILQVRTRDEMGDIALKKLVIELMGRHSNLILVDPSSNRVIDSIRHVTLSMSRYRTVLPGREYIFPPDQGKKNPLWITEDQFIRSLQFNQGKLDQQLVNQFTGLSPLVAKEILYRAGLPNRENLWESFSSIMEEIKHKQYQPTLADSGKKIYFSAVRLSHVEGNIKTFESMSLCLEHYFEHKAEQDLVKQKGQDLFRILQHELKKNENKLEKMERERKDAEDGERYKLYGELITVYMHQIKKGDKEALVNNYYEKDDAIVSIPLDPKKSPAENAQHYFKKYNKSKTSLIMLKKQINKTREEINYLNTILHQLSHASLSDIEEIREELQEQGYLKHRKRMKGSKKREHLPQLEQFQSSTGFTIYLGKNNKQNDYLTNRLAKPTDTWLHTKDIPGSHVVIRGKDVDEISIKEAAQLAAYFSKARHSSQVPVDYTLVKHVKKPNGAKPGFVIYDNQKTIFVTPNEKILEKSKKRPS